MSITNVINGVISTKHFRSLVLVVALLVGVVAPVVTASSASAEGGCPPGYVCVYEHANYGGNSVWYLVQAHTCYSLNTLNNKASSLVNNTSRSITYFDDSGCNSTSRLSDGSYSHRANLANNFWDWNSNPLLVSPNDKISSFYVY